MRNHVGSAAIVLLAAAIVYASLPSAKAQTARTAECVALASLTGKMVAGAYEDQMNKWLAAGKTDFVTTPVGVCAW